MATVVNDIDEPPGSKCNPSGLRRFTVPNRNESALLRGLEGPLNSTEDLASLIFGGHEPVFLRDRTKEELVVLIEDIAAYCATLRRENRVVVVGRVSRKVLRVGIKDIDKAMEQDASCIMVGSVGKTTSGDTADFERRLSAIERKLELEG